MSAVRSGLCVVALAASAQSDRGAITGIISYLAGPAIPNANVEARNTETAAAFAGDSSSTGNYVMAVPVGNCELVVTMSGFKIFIGQNL